MQLTMEVQDYTDQHLISFEFFDGFYSQKSGFNITGSVKIMRSYLKNKKLGWPTFFSFDLLFRNTVTFFQY